MLIEAVIGGKQEAHGLGKPTHLVVRVQIMKTLEKGENVLCKQASPFRGNDDGSFYDECHCDEILSGALL